LKMVSMLESSPPDPEDDFPDDLTPRPLEDLVDDGEMPPPSYDTDYSVKSEYHLGFRHDYEIHG